MKALSLIILLPILICSKNLNLTTRLGINLAGTVGKDAAVSGYTRSPEPGISTGAGVEYRFSKLAAAVEILFSQKGVRYLEAQSIGTSVELNYLEIPITVNYKIETNQFILLPSLGLAPSILLSETGKHYLMGEKEDAELRDISRHDLGAVLGFSVGKDLVNGTLAFNIRGTIGLLSNDKSGKEKDYNANLNLSLTYRFKLCREE